MHLLDGISSIRELNLKNQKVLVRADLEASESQATAGLIAMKCEALLPTLQWAAEQEARIIVAAHRGQPGGPGPKAPSLESAGIELSKLSGWEVFLPDDCVGDAAKRVISDLRAGQICLLENLWHHPEEAKGDEAFARALAAWCDVYVNDAFAACDRKYASLNALARLTPIRGSGLLLEREVNALSRLTTATEHPVVGVLGAPATEQGLELVELFLKRCDHVCLGGGLAMMVLAASGKKLTIEQAAEGLLPRCRSLLERHDQRLSLPTDVRSAAGTREPPSNTSMVAAIPAGHTAFDLGPKSLDDYSKKIAGAKTIVYTGHMSATPSEPVSSMSQGTDALLESVAQASGFSLVIGDDTVLWAARANADLIQQFDHVSLGGHTTFSFLAGKRLPGIDALRGASHE